MPNIPGPISGPFERSQCSSIACGPQADGPTVVVRRDNSPPIWAKGCAMAEAVIDGQLIDRLSIRHVPKDALGKTRLAEIRITGNDSPFVWAHERRPERGRIRGSYRSRLPRDNVP